MKLYIKQKVLAWKDKFTVKDEKGNDIFYVEGELISLGKKLHIYDTNKREVALIKEKLLRILPEYHVYVDEEKVAEIEKQLTLVMPKFEIKEFKWETKGNLVEHDYEIKCKRDLIASIHKKWFSWGDSYEIDIVPEADVLMVLAMVLVIDCIEAEEREKKIEREEEDN